MTYSLLSGVRVLEIGSMLSAPYCGKLLADAGARVVKLEPPEVRRTRPPLRSLA